MPRERGHNFVAQETQDVPAVRLQQNRADHTPPKTAPETLQQSRPLYDRRTHHDGIVNSQSRNGLSRLLQTRLTVVRHRVVIGRQTGLFDDTPWHRREF